MINRNESSKMEFEKKMYVAPEAKIKKFSVANIITTSEASPMETQGVYDGSDADQYDDGQFKS